MRGGGERPLRLGEREPRRPQAASSGPGVAGPGGAALPLLGEARSGQGAGARAGPEWRAGRGVVGQPKCLPWAWYIQSRHSFHVNHYGRFELGPRDAIMKVLILG